MDMKESYVKKTRTNARKRRLKGVFHADKGIVLTQKGVIAVTVQRDTRVIHVRY